MPEERFDPYRPPAVDAILMDDEQRPLTSSERRVLELYYTHRDRPFTTLGMIKRMLPNWCLIAVIFAILLAIIRIGVLADRHVLQLILVWVCGTMFGVILRDLGVARRLIRMWPVLRSVFDWKKVEERLE
jgi:hypothetical protein